MLTNVLSELQISKIDAKKLKEQNFRTRVKGHKFELSNVLGQVSRDIYSNMIKACHNSDLKEIEHVQPNGDWQLMEWDYKTGLDDNDNECIHIVCKYIDVAGEEDLQYRGSVPVTEVNVRMTQPTQNNDALVEILNRLADEKNKKG